MMKICSKCRLEKPFSEFNKSSSARDGYQYRCTDCRKKYYLENRENIIRKNVEYERANKAKSNIRKKRYVDKNKKICDQRTRDWQDRNSKHLKYLRAARYARDPSIALDICRRRQLSKKFATPVWSNRFFILEAYRLARLREKLFGFKWNVDHIVPLKNKSVCGLHVECNLAVVPDTVNKRKFNSLLVDAANINSGYWLGYLK